MAAFLIRNLAPDLRLALELDAVSQDLPIQEIVRSILCEEYGFSCEHEPGARRTDAWEGATTILLKNVDPGLFEQIKLDAQTKGVSMRELIVDVLTGRYVTGAAA